MKVIKEGPGSHENEISGLYARYRSAVYASCLMVNRAVAEHHTDLSAAQPYAPIAETLGVETFALSGQPDQSEQSEQPGQRVGGGILSDAVEMPGYNTMISPGIGDISQQEGSGSGYVLAA